MQDLIDHHKHGSDYMAIAMSSLPSSMTSSSTSASPQVPCTKCPQLRADIKDPEATLGQSPCSDRRHCAQVCAPQRQSWWWQRQCRWQRRRCWQRPRSRQRLWHPWLTSISIYMQSGVSAPRADEHLDSYAERCLCVESWRASRFTCRSLLMHRDLTSISTHMQSTVSAPRAGEHLDSRTAHCLCTEV